MKIYDSLVDSVEGVLMGTAVCGQDNRKEWLTRMPVFFKLAAIDQILRGSKRKNVYRGLSSGPHRLSGRDAGGMSRRASVCNQ